MTDFNKPEPSAFDGVTLALRDMAKAPFSLVRGIFSTGIDILTGYGGANRSRDTMNREINQRAEQSEENRIMKIKDRDYSMNPLQRHKILEQEIGVSTGTQDYRENEAALEHRKEVMERIRERRVYSQKRPRSQGRSRTSRQHQREDQDRRSLRSRLQGRWSTSRHQHLLGRCKDLRLRPR